MPATSTTPSKPSLHSRRVLVVDDSTDIVETFSTILALIGHDVRVAYDGGGAVDIALSFEPEVVFLDIGLPVLDGISVCRKLRERIGGAVQIYAVTGYGDEVVRSEAMDAGFNGYFVKPVSPLAVLEELELTNH